MEWREQSNVSCDAAFLETQRWVQAVTKKTFGRNNFRSALENGVLLCDLINRIEPGIIKRVNRLSTPIAGLDNINVFLKACGKLGLKEAQLFHPGDLQDTSTRVTVKHQETSRRLKNVLITLYWLGRKTQSDPFFDGPNLNLNAFEGLLGITALAKALEESPVRRASSGSIRERDSGFGESWCSDREKEDIFPSLRGVHRRENSFDSLESLGSRPHSRSSDNTLKGSSEGCGSDAEADSDFRMAGDSSKDSLHYRRSLVIAPKTAAQFNQFLPTRDKPAAYVPAPLRKKRAERNEENRRSWASPMFTEEDGAFTSETRPESSNESASRNSMPPVRMQWVYEYESGSDAESDAERPDPDLVLDDLASRRFHSPSSALPTNFALPISPLEVGNATGLKEKGGGVLMERGGAWPMVTVTTNTNESLQQKPCLSSDGPEIQMCSPMHPMGTVRADHHRPLSTDSLLQQMYNDSDDEEDDVGYADPVQDDLYTRKVGMTPKVPVDVSYDRFLPKFWTPEEDAHVQKIKLGSQRRPWYKKIQGFSRKKSGGSSSDESDCDISPWLSSAPPPSGPSPSSHPHAPEGPSYTSHPAASQRLLQKHNVASDRSKSMTDLGVETAALKQVQYEELQKMREMVKETEDQWQDDLNKWKNRRKSVNSDIVKKKEEREQIEQTTVSSSFQRSSRSSIGSRLNSLASLDQDVFEDSTPIIRPRTLHARSYTIDSSYISPRDPSPTPPTLPRAKEENPVPTYTTTTNRDISPSMDDMSDSATNSDSDTDSVGPTPNYNPLIPTPSEKAPSPASRYTSAAKMEEPSSATSGTNQTSNYIPRVPTLRTNENAPCPPPWCPSAARTEKTSIVTTDFGRASKYNPHVLAPTPSEKASTPAAKVEETSSASTAAPSNLLPKVTESRLPWEGKGAKEVTPSIGAGSLCKPPEHNYVAMETKYIPPVVSRVSSSLPRGYVRSDSARLTSVITARPFGNQSSRVASLPRAYTMDDSYKRVNGETEVSKKPLAPSRYSQVITSEDEAHSSSPHSSGGEEDEGQEEAEKNIQMGRGVTPTLAPSLVLAPVRSISPIFQPPKVAFPENYSDMRISLNQKPNQSKDFGFQTKWDSTGVCVTSIQPGSSAEMCQLQVGDKVLSVSGRSVDKMSFSEWTSSQELALRKGSLTMDLRRHGRKNWDIDLPSLPFKNRKTINLTSMDNHPTLVGSPDMTTVNATTTSLDFTSRGSMEPTKELPNKPIIDVASNGLKGGFREETVISRNIESVEPISLKNLKRRSEFFEQGGSESTISDIPVPPITSTSDRWTWDGEAERRRQEKWQQEQERILQEKYRFDQKKLEEEWRRAQREAGTDGESYNNAPQEPKDLQVENRSRQFSPASPCQPALTREDQEEEIRKKREEENERKKCVEEENERKKRVEEENERKKRVEEENERKKRVEEENERKKRVEENERKKRVEEEHRRGEEERRKERELLRLQEEKQEDEKRRKQREEELRWQRRKEEEREESRRQEAEQQRREQERKQEQQQCMGDSYGYAKVKPELFMVDREKSKSIPDIDDMEKSETTGWYKGSGGMAQRLLEEELRRKADKNAQGLRAASELELERRNILNAMKYREPERVASSGGLGEASWRKGQQTLSQAELERQQILQEMKKTTQLSTDNSWIRPSSISTDTVKDHTAGLVRRGESLDNLDANPRSSWRSSWTPGSTSSISTYSMPSNISGLNTTSFSGGAGYSDNGVGSRPGSATLPSSHSMSSLKGNGGSNPSSWSQHSSSSPSPIPSPGLESESRLSTQQRNRSVSGKKICTFCDTTLGKGAAMIIESLGLCYHLTCFKCMDCKSDLGGSEAGAEVRIRNRQLYCNSCYMRFKTGQVKM